MKTNTPDTQPVPVMVKCAWSKCDKMFPASTRPGQQKKYCCSAHRANGNQEERKPSPERRACLTPDCVELVKPPRRRCKAHAEIHDKARRHVAHDKKSAEMREATRAKRPATRAGDGIQPIGSELALRPCDQARVDAVVAGECVHRAWAKPMWVLRICACHRPDLMTAADYDYLDAHHADRAKTIRNLSGLVYP